MQKRILKKQGATTPPVVREYDIRGTRYIVKATFKDGDGEDAVTILRRLMRNDISKSQKAESK